MTETKIRLPAGERRAALIEAGLRAFAGGSYSGATTAEIAREAGVSEPILYRHFGCKRDLYLACLDEAWSRLRTEVERVIAAEEDPREWPLAVKKAAQCLRDRRLLPINLWIQALSEAGEDREIRRHLRRQLRQAHAFLADVMGRADAAGGLAPGRDPTAEAWISLAVGLLRSVQDRLGGLLTDEDFAGIAQSRRRWLTGE
jgi:AcrR family transcriptional regulator